MDDLEPLVMKAREKRDAAIREARRVFMCDIAHIRALSRGLKLPASERRRFPPGTNTIFEILVATIPPDGEFTVPGLIQTMETAHPDRVFHGESIRTYITRLMDRGKIHRTRKAKGVMYFAADTANIPTDPWLGVTAPQAARRILTEQGPKNLLELVVALQEAGYRKDLDPRDLRTTLASALRAHPELFCYIKGKRWAVR